jgi:ribose transport system permease protein
MLSGLTAAIAGVMLAGYLTEVGVNHADGYLFRAFAATVIGGVSLSGGVGRISGVFGGAFLLPIITTGLVMLGVSAKLIDFALGLVVILALIIDCLKKKVWRLP